MSTVYGIGTTYNLPNYNGELIAVSPTDTPLLSISGGLNEGKACKARNFGWQTEDLRDPEIRPRFEGADAPTAESRARANIENTVQIFHESVSTSYSKLAATGQVATPAAAPFSSTDGAPNPIVNEHDHQILNALKTIARDVNYTFWHGKRVNPTTNDTAPATAGLLSVVTANRVATGEKTGLASGASNIISETGTALANGDKIVFTAPPVGLRADRIYYVVNKATDSFKVAATEGGAAITIAADQAGIAYVPAKTAASAEGLSSLMQMVFDAGGISEQEAATLFVSSRQKRAISKVYAELYGKADPLSQTRKVAGVNVNTIETDFGVLNIVIDRALPPDAIAVVSMEQIDPVFMETPEKGVLFYEALAKTGASERHQIYGEIGLKYGNPLAHGVIRGWAV